MRSLFLKVTAHVTLRQIEEGVPRESMDSMVKEGVERPC